MLPQRQLDLAQFVNLVLNDLQLLLCNIAYLAAGASIRPGKRKQGSDMRNRQPRSSAVFDQYESSQILVTIAPVATRTPRGLRKQSNFFIVSNVRCAHACTLSELTNVVFAHNAVFSYLARIFPLVLQVA